MKVLCPHCNYEYPDISKNLRNQIVLCANCNEEFVADDGLEVSHPSISALNKGKKPQATISETIQKKQPVKKTINKIKQTKSATRFCLRIFGILLFLFGFALFIFSDRPQGLMLLSGSMVLIGLARIVYLLEYISDLLHQSYSPKK